MIVIEIVGLFCVGVLVVNVVIKVVCKLDVLNDYEVCCYMWFENGLYVDVYVFEIIIFIVFWLNIYCMYVF